MPGEFEIIARYFDREGLAASGDPRIPLGIGDDCALIEVPPGRQLALTMDMLVVDVHFPAGADPASIGHKALAVNLSDLAAMGAEPFFFTLGLALAEAGEHWLEGFSGGLRELAGRYGCRLVGGDVTRGRLSIAIQAHGLVEPGRAVTRAGAHPGDLVFVTGCLGDSGLGLQLVSGTRPDLALSESDRGYFEQAYHRPEPRVDFGRLLPGFASAAIDVSDGLLADLGHIAERSGAGIRLRAADIPLSAALERAVGRDKGLEFALCAGDDYELAICVPPDKLEEFRARAAASPLLCSCIGEVVAGAGV